MKKTIPLLVALAVLLPLTGGGLTAFAQRNLTPPPAKGVAAGSEISVRRNAQTTTEEHTLPLTARPIYNGSPNERPVPDWKRKGLRQKGLFPDFERTGLTGTEKIDRSDVVDDNIPRDNMALQFAKVLGVTVEQAIQRMESQGARIALGEQITERLGARAVGFILDQLNDTIIVNVLDEDAASQVRSLGATARLVHRSWEELEAIKESLTSRFAIVDTAVGIDVKRNQVLVTILDGEGDELPDSLRIPSTVDGLSTSRDEGLSALIHASEAFGEAVVIEHRPGTFTPLLKGGGKIGVQGSCANFCSAGLLRVFPSGFADILTAGHCTSAVSNWTHQNSCQYMGTSYFSNLYRGYDSGGVTWNNSKWPFKLGQIHAYPGSLYVNAIDTNFQPDQVVCKSGAATGITCGSVYVPSRTADTNYGTLYDVAEVGICAAGGDSGGPVFRSVGGSWVNPGGLISGTFGSSCYTFVQGF